jgi:hypothetical protein
LGTAFRYAAQFVLYVAFGVAIAWFSRYPVFHALPSDQALVRLSFSHGAKPKSPCRTRTPEELAKLAPNMRLAEDCPRERSPIKMQLEMDGKLLYEIVAPPTGLARDGAATVYRRLPVPAGTHRFRVRLADGPDGAFVHDVEKTVELAAGSALLIDFQASQGGFVFRQ